MGRRNRTATTIFCRRSRRADPGARGQRSIVDTSLDCSRKGACDRAVKPKSIVPRPTGRWDNAYRQKDDQVPEDFQAALDTNPASAATFAGLSKQTRFAFVFRLGNVKRADTRERKIKEYVKILERGE